MRNLLFKIIPITVFLIISLFSCNKKNQELDIEPVEFAARTFHIELSNHHLLNKFRLDFIDQLVPKSVDIDTSVFQATKIFILDFGKGYGCKDGVIRRGKIQIQEIKDTINPKHYQLSTTWLDSFGVYLNNQWHYLQGSSEHVFLSNGSSFLRCQTLISNSKLTSTFLCDSLSLGDIWDSNVNYIVGDYAVNGEGSIDGLDFNLNAKILANQGLLCLHSGTMTWDIWEYDYDPYKESKIDDWVKITNESNEYFFHLR